MVCTTMIVRVDWRALRGDDDLGWTYSGVLYTYLVPPEDEIVYIGKADGRTVRQRWTRAAKESFWDALERERRIFRHRVLVGELQLPARTRLTRELLVDVESLLISKVRPWGNIQARHSRISRPGLRVRCYGEWAYGQAEFLDEEY